MFQCACGGPFLGTLVNVNRGPTDPPPPARETEPEAGSAAKAEPAHRLGHRSDWGSSKPQSTLTNISGNSDSCIEETGSTHRSVSAVHL